MDVHWKNSSISLCRMSYLVTKHWLYRIIRSMHISRYGFYGYRNVSLDFKNTWNDFSVKIILILSLLILMCIESLIFC